MDTGGGSHIISIDHRSMLFVDDVELGTHLTKKETAVLRAVMSHERVATKEHLLNVVYGGQDEPELKIIDVFICKLRAKLCDHGGALQTVWGRGYCRHPDYTLALEINSVAVPVDANLLEEVVAAGGEPPQELVNRLLKAEHKRLWSEAA